MKHTHCAAADARAEWACSHYVERLLARLLKGWFGWNRAALEEGAASFLDPGLKLREAFYD
jgi:hypothetical protein